VPVVNYNTFLGSILAAIEGQRPFSFVRMGDGEGIVIGYPRYTSMTRCLQRYEKWFRSDSLTVESMKELSSNIRESCRCADIVGLPSSRHKSMGKDWRNVRTYSEALGILSSSTKTCPMDFVIDMQVRGDFRKILRHREVRCITCRNVKKQLQGLGASSIETLFLPPQVKPMFGADYSNKEQHYPNLYTKIHEWISGRPGGLYFIGAGGLGKVYCQWVKESGGVAIDIGSVFDGWAGLPTRTHLRIMMDRFKILPLHPRVEI
jgi:hypothetical protein